MGKRACKPPACVSPLVSHAVPFSFPTPATTRHREENCRRLPAPCSSDCGCRTSSLPCATHRPTNLAGGWVASLVPAPCWHLPWLWRRMRRRRGLMVPCFPYPSPFTAREEEGAGPGVSGARTRRMGARGLERVVFQVGSPSW